METYQLELQLSNAEQQVPKKDNVTQQTKDKLDSLIWDYIPMEDVLDLKRRIGNIVKASKENCMYILVLFAIYLFLIALVAGVGALLGTIGSAFVSSLHHANVNEAVKVGSLAGATAAVVSFHATFATIVVWNLIFRLSMVIFKEGWLRLIVQILVLLAIWLNSIVVSSIAGAAASWVTGNNISHGFIAGAVAGSFEFVADGFKENAEQSQQPNPWLLIMSIRILGGLSAAAATTNDLAGGTLLGLWSSGVLAGINFNK